ncbi:MAG TPA: DDE-type integrase/transposase/recombinase [Candidatus Dormibacteraeota bacterium]
MTLDAAEAVALRRYALIAEAANPRLTPRERGQIVRAVAARVHEHPDGSDWVICRGTLDRWLRAYQQHGLEGLKPKPRADAGTVRRHPDLFQEAAALRLEHPARSAAHIADILHARHGIRISERTVREQLHKRGLDRARLNAEHRSYGRYEASRPSERWIGDVLVGPWVPYPRQARSRQARLFLLVDDHSRLLVHGSWCSNENTRAGQQVLRAAITRRGLPEQIYVDNGAPFANAALERTCAVLGVHLIHSRPYSPEGRGKQERLNRVIRERFLIEAEAAGIRDLDELNDRFIAWVETYLNCRVHAETKQTPIQRFQAQGQPPAVDPQLLHEAFRWSCLRKVSRTATVSLLGNRYQVDAALLGRQVELRYDPEDMSRITVHFQGRSAGQATPFHISHHVHPQVPQALPAAVEATGVDYLGMILSAHEDATREGIAYRQLDLSRPEDA